MTASLSFSSCLEDSKYAISEDFGDFNTGSATCKAAGGIPLVLHAESEFTDLVGLIGRREVPLGSDAYIGLREDDVARGNFQWADGTSLVYGLTDGEFPWKTGNPSNAAGQCVKLNVKELTWEDVDCSTSLKMICEAPCSNSKSPYKVEEIAIISVLSVVAVLALVGLILLAMKYRYDKFLQGGNVIVKTREEAEAEGGIKVPSEMPHYIGSMAFRRPSFLARWSHGSEDFKDTQALKRMEPDGGDLVSVYRGESLFREVEYEGKPAVPSNSTQKLNF